MNFNSVNLASMYNNNFRFYQIQAVEKTNSTQPTAVVPHQPPNGVCLVMEGGGVRGAAHVGGLKALEELNIIPCAFAGSSAGAIVASLAAVGYSADELLDVMLKTDFQKFLDPVSSIPVIRHWVAYRKQGVYKGDEFHRWIDALLSAKCKGSFYESPTFADIDTPLILTGVDIVRERLVIFSRETYPDLPISDAVRISMSLPLFFRPVKFGGSLMVDGGVNCNYPASVFQQLQNHHSLPILGFRFEPETTPLAQPKGMLDFLRRIVGVSINCNSHWQEQNVENLCTIKLPTLGVGVADFHISTEKKRSLYAASRKRVHTMLGREEN